MGKSQSNRTSAQTEEREERKDEVKSPSIGSDDVSGLFERRFCKQHSAEAEASRVGVAEHESEASHAVARDVPKATWESPKGAPFQRGDRVPVEQETACGPYTVDETRAIRAETSKSTPKPLFQITKEKELMNEVESALVHGEKISGTSPAELAYHIVVGESYGVVNKAVEELAASAGTIIDEKIDNDFIGKAAGWMVGKGVENVLTPAEDVSRVVAERGSEAAHDVARNVRKATGGSLQGVPDVEPTSIDPTDVGSKSVDLTKNVGPTTTLLVLTDGDAVEKVTVDLGLGEGASSALGGAVSAVTDEAATELAKAVVDYVPIVGQVNDRCYGRGTPCFFLGSSLEELYTSPRNLF